ncbi:hypothetical protein [Actinoplanes aureus]|uniref:Uncharacterized protein n=1 Tax=Actinoplanes aureus TaxID=2792083 RepID=A0A931FXY3_9ACTN|nr:hypothetical protein [Actinoplanes aureus]MBG0564028.1 hypothetical protein [Actinoplanes aureus]
MEDGDDWEPLFVGSVIGGSSPDNRASRAAVSALAREVGRLPWEFVSEETGVDVAFHIPGPLLQPDYAGIRTGSVSRKQRLIAVQIAVPADITSKSDEETLRLLAEYLVSGVEIARDAVARRKGMPPVMQAVTLARLAHEAITE